VKGRPILFSSPMVRAILDGSKTQTRRSFAGTLGVTPCPYGVPGDRLWVRETFVQGHPSDAGEVRYDLPLRYWYRADGDLDMWAGEDGHAGDVPWRPSIHMPRAASRITLEITDVRVERLQAISEEDALAEGVPFVQNDPFERTARREFQDLWDSLNAKRAPWASNPWVWCLTFKRVTP